MACVRSGQAAAWPLVSGRSVRRGSGVKRDFACTFTRQLLLCSLPCGLQQSCLRLEGRTRTLRRPSPDLSLALARAPSRHRHRTRIARRAARSLTMVRRRLSRKDPVGGAAPIACTSGWDVPVNGAARARQVQVRENQRESPLRAVALRPAWHVDLPEACPRTDFVPLGYQPQDHLS